MSKKLHTKYIFVTGGVTSSLGKGILSASLGYLLQCRGFKITILKLDPYINIDPGTMNPYEHGEVYVTHDGAETDLDLGHYERFLNISLSKKNNLTTGFIYNSVIKKEREGEYLGKTIQIIPHITDEIKNHVYTLANDTKVDIVLIEVGGTVGDIESLPFIETIRQIRYEKGHENTLSIHLTLVPYLAKSQELKTKPTQHSVKKLTESGLTPDILVCRSSHALNQAIKQKIGLFCNVQNQDVIQSIDAPSIYHVPINLNKELLDDRVIKKLHLDASQPNLQTWKTLINHIEYPTNTIDIALIGKYADFQDAYKSIIESCHLAGIKQKCKINMILLHSDKLTKQRLTQKLKKVHAIIVAPGFGERGIEGKLHSISMARLNKIPFLGICLGFQCAVIEVARNMCGLIQANSTEFDSNTNTPVIDIMDNQRNIKNKGGSMRLGVYPCHLIPNSHIAKAHKTNSIEERHRHRYEINNKYLDAMKKHGFRVTGINKKDNLVEAMELDNHPWFVGVQYHPEYTSSVTNPNPLFIELIDQGIKHKQLKENSY